MQSDTLKIAGRVKVWKNARLVYEGRNLIVLNGLTLLAEIIGASGTKPSHMAIGGDSSQPSEDQSSLVGTEFERVTVGTAQNDREVAYSATFGSGLSSTQTVQEFGIFNSASAGTMLARFVSPAIDLQPNETLDVNWTMLIGGE